jgi:hypothetical protein
MKVLYGERRVFATYLLPAFTVLDLFLQPVLPATQDDAHLRRSAHVSTETEVNQCFGRNGKINEIPAKIYMYPIIT